MNQITKIISITMMTLMVFMACENSDKIMGPNYKQSPEMSVLAKGQGGGTVTTCSAEGTWTGYNETNDPDYSIYEYTLWAGQHNDAGTVTITNDDQNIYVTYNTNETADLGEIHVYVWTSTDDIPTRRPAPGQADYVVEDINSDSYTLTIPNNGELECGTTFYISTHAALVGDNPGDTDEPGDGSNAGETAYGGDSGSPACFDATKGAWWGYLAYTVECFYDLSGTVYEDTDNSGDLEIDEDGFGGITVNLLDADDNLVASATTNDDGTYLFEHVAGGADYTVVSDAPEGDYLANENADGYSITDLSDNTSNVDFGFVSLVDCNECSDGELVVNGSFEDGFNGWANNFGHSSSGYPIDRGTFWSTDGWYGIDLIGTGPSAPGFVEQTLCTEVGEEYELSFDAEFVGSSGALVVTIDGNSQNISSTGSHAILFTATSTSTTVRFEANAYYNYLYNNVLLDNVSVACGDDDPPTGDGDFPLWGQDISHVILVFSGSSAPNGDAGDDGYYTIKIDEYQDADEDDLDNDIDDYLAALVAQGYLIDGDYDLLGSSIKGGLQTTSFYAYGSHNTNGTAADTPPSGLGFSYPGGSQNESPQSAIDVTIDRSNLF